MLDWSGQEGLAGELGRLRVVASALMVTGTVLLDQIGTLHTLACNVALRTRTRQLPAIAGQALHVRLALLRVFVAVHLTTSSATALGSLVLPHLGPALAAPRALAGAVGPAEELGVVLVVLVPAMFSQHAMY